MTDGQEVVTLFNQSNKVKRSITSPCNCPTSVKAGPVVTMDTSLDRKMEVMYYDEKSHSIMAADGDSCRCRKVISKGSASNNGLPPDLLTVDHLHVYWYNKKEQMLYTLHKTTGELTSESVPDVQDILAYGAHLQPLPSSECLDPEAYSGSVDLIERTNTSIKVRLQEVTWPQVCDGISHPDTKYTVYYSAGTKGDNCGLERIKCQSKKSNVSKVGIYFNKSYFFTLTKKKACETQVTLSETQVTLSETQVTLSETKRHRLHCQRQRLHCQDKGYTVRDTGYTVRDAGYTVRDKGYTVRDTGYTVGDTGYTVRDKGYTVRDTGYTVGDKGYTVKTQVTLSETKVTMSETPVTLSETQITLSETQITLSETQVTLSETKVSLLRHRLHCQRQRLHCQRHRLHCQRQRLQCQRHRLHCQRHRLHCQTNVTLSETQVTLSETKVTLSRHGLHCQRQRLQCQRHRLHCQRHRLHCQRHRLHCQRQRLHCQDTGYTVRDKGYTVRDTDYTVRDKGYNVRDTGYTVRDTDYTVRDIHVEWYVFQTSYLPELIIDGLSPYTWYVLHGAVSNYYREYLSEALGQPVIYQTKVGVPSAVRNIKAEVFSPEQITVTWFPPAIQNGLMDDLRYIIKFSTQTSDGKYLEDTTNSSAVIPEYTEKNVLKNYKVDLQQLRPDHLYTITVLVSNVHNPDLQTASTSIQRRTYQLPNNFKTKFVSSNAIHLEWWSPSDNSVVRNKIQIGELISVQLNPTHISIYTTQLNTTQLSSSHLNVTQQLISSNLISTHLISSHLNSTQLKTSIPEKPSPPKVIALKTGGYEVEWSEPYDSGDTITNYLLEYRGEGDQYWKQAYNNSVPRWVIDEEIVPSGYDYRFRVAAQNSFGIGDYSENSTIFSFPAWRKRQEEKKKPTQFIAVARGPDLELATLRELPHTAFQQSNTLYAFNTVPTPEDIIALPHFSRDQLMLTKFLGSGAFGEVFEGLAKNIISDSSGETRVAVKTLRKSASDHEKEEFLKGGFTDDLLGVCLDNDPQFIILELMEGGDLLTFLRASRPSSVSVDFILIMEIIILCLFGVSPSYLCLTDLLKICVDVAKGCQYLEEMHFVHRDLAARNCLVSSKNPSEMIVKIGDFGLARDIYKNDYYRKEGEGLLPVRWMSPESLVDGVFTTQSDIWCQAFAVLVWEVLTFGQQPYPARTNVEVLQFVRSGGQLDQPENCPQEIYQLLTKCWNFASEDRPNFTYILQQLDQFYQKCLTLLSDYIMPVRSRPQPQADGQGQEPSSRNSWRSNRQDVHPSSINRVVRPENSFPSKNSSFHASFSCIATFEMFYFIMN
ncbi:hypothetical protein KUTeg_007086 [Tegillarca granosa]|uniref:Tyrosine-protein kinase receptor n=1 Tax=Tegillarca granosa TaxID=220873 RepID=A0ABQ9FFG1_TEGGR|nr:hypothetical protein KUTeg_007086 [Tegillarca granosa]